MSDAVAAPSVVEHDFVVCWRLLARLDNVRRHGKRVNQAGFMPFESAINAVCGCRLPLCQGSERNVRVAVAFKCWTLELLLFQREKWVNPA